MSRIQVRSTAQNFSSLMGIEKYIFRGGLSLSRFIPSSRFSNKASSNGTDNTGETDEHPVQNLIRDATLPQKHEDVTPEFYSDLQNNIRRDQTRKSFRPKINPEETSVLLFPGQGSQFVGMGKKLVAIPKVREIYDVASEILGYNLLNLCLHGPKEKLDRTIHCQPAIYVASLAAVEKLKEENEKAIENCICAVGFSLGEFAALVFADSLSFEKGLEIVHTRAKAMQSASEETSSGMMSAFLGPANKIKLACHTAKLYCTKELKMDPERVECVVANYLYPECKVIAGNIEALDFIKKNAKDFGILRTKMLPVSGAFHSQLMLPAKKMVADALATADLRPPIVSVHSNVDTYRYSNVKKMRQLLGEQLHQPVRWEQLMHTVYSRDKGVAFPRSFEVGPGRQLGAILRMTNNKAYQNYQPVDV